MRKDRFFASKFHITGMKTRTMKEVISYSKGDSDLVTKKEALKGLISNVVEASNQVAYQELAGLGHDLESQDIVHQTILSWFNNNILIKR
jgi:hypothetical protein